MRGSTRLFRPHPALARHLPHPGEGYYGGFVRHRDSADSLVRLRSRTEKIRTSEKSLPPGGEGGAPATDEGENGEWNHFMQLSRRRSLSFQRGRLFSVVRGVVWFLLTMEIPPAGAPLGAGFAVRQWLVVARDFWWAVPLRSG